MSETFRFQPGLAYGQKGAKDTSSSVDHELELTYLELPLLGVLSLPTEGAVGLHVFAGPAIGFELGCKWSGEGQETLDCSDGNVEIGTKSLDVGFSLGAAVSFATSESMSFFVDVYYTLGLTNIREDAGEDESVKNRSMGIDLGLAFRRGG